MHSKRFLPTFALAVLIPAAAAAAQTACGPMPAGDTSAQDKKFLMEEAQAGLFEVTISKLAVKKAKDPEVQQIAKLAYDDNASIDQDLRPFDSKMMVRTPTKLNTVHQQEAERLKSMSGAKFDAEYIKAMDAIHHKEMGDFRSERDTTSNADLKAAVGSAYSVVKEHTSKIDAVATRMNLPVPADSAPMTPSSM